MPRLILSRLTLPLIQLPGQFKDLLTGLTRRCHMARAEFAPAHMHGRDMPHRSIAGRWQAALGQAAQRTLAARWRITLEALDAARREYRALCEAAAIDVRALRKAAQRMYDLEQLRTVLAHEIGVPTRGRQAASGPLFGPCGFLGPDELGGQP